MAKLTLIGMSNFDPDLFTGLTFPEGIDKDTAVKTILMEGGEFELLYPDSEFLKRSFFSFSKKWKRTFEKWIEAYNLEYSPLDNYDRTEEWTDERIGKVSNITDTIAANTKNSTTGTSDTSTTTGSGSGDTTNTRSAFDSDSYQPHDKSENTSQNTSTTTGQSSMTSNDTVNDTISVSGSENNTDNLVHRGRIRGNIGVTTSMQLLREQYDIATWNLYNQIAELFIKEYMIPIYD